jgi:hypothetical protein
MTSDKLALKTFLRIEENQILHNRDASRIMLSKSKLSVLMKQPEDQRTIELSLDSAAARKRGRPPKADKLSDAERARRYRARQKMMPKDDWNYEQLTALTRAEILRLTNGAAARPRPTSSAMPNGPAATGRARR